MKHHKLMIIAGIVLGAASVATIASCLPDEAAPVAEAPAAEVVTDSDYPGMDTGTLDCGELAKPAVDYAPVAQGGPGWWAYCEPALIGEAVTAPVDAPGGAVDPASIAAALGTACATEDSTDCFWDASIQGNGDGASFVNIEGHIFPLDDILGH